MASKPIRPVQRAHRERRRPRTPNPQVRTRILRAAADLISRQGVPELRIEDLAQQAGLSVGTFYLYFEGKADLFAQLVVETTRGLRRRLRAAYDGPGDTMERLSAAIDDYLDFVAENEKGFLYFRDAGTVHTTVGPLSSWAFAQHAEDLRPLLEEAMNAGEIMPENPELLAQALLGLMQHLAGYWLENRDRVQRADVRRLLLALGRRVLPV